MLSCVRCSYSMSCRFVSLAPLAHQIVVTFELYILKYLYFLRCAPIPRQSKQILLL